jgi:long-chain acyl-CoA synthetase
MDSGSVYLKRPWVRFYQEGITSELKFPEISLPEAFDSATERWKKKTALVFYGKKISYGELRELIDRFATALHRLGVKKGDRVALHLLNSPQFVIAYFGALKLGAVITPISPVYVSSEIRHQIEDSGAETIVCQDVLYHVIEETKLKFKRVIITNINEYLPKLSRILGKSILSGLYKTMQTPTSEFIEGGGLYQFKSLLQKYSPDPPRVDINPKEDLAVLPYTSGTTALPKGTMLTHYNLLASESLLKEFLRMEEGREVDLAYMPFYFVGGQLIIMLRALLRGSTLVIFTTPDPDDILAAAEKYKATIFIGAPSMYEILRDYEKTDRVDWQRFKYILAGADTLLEDTAEGWKKKTGTMLHECWGMTETSGIGMFTPKGNIKVGSFGVPMSNCVGAIVDPDTNEFLPLGEIGELIFHGPGVMKGYWKAPEETRKVLIEIDGTVWLRTGDLVKMDEDGYFWFYDRKRDRIKYKGYRMSAREIEEVISSHPQVKEVGVVGVPDPKVGERIKAVVVAQGEARGKLSEEDIVRWCGERLAPYKVPKIVEFRGEIPKTDIGKVSRREIREE